MKISSSQRLLLLAAVLLLLASCKLEKSIDPAKSKSDTTVTTGNNNEGNTTISGDAYLPVTKGTYWKYAIADSTGPIDTSTITLTGKTAVFNTNTYCETITATRLHPLQVIGYLYSANHTYRQRQGLTGNAIDLYEMNDTVPKGHSWTVPLNETGLVNGIPGQVIGTIIEKGVTKTVNDKAYTDVIESQVEIQYDYGSGYQMSQLIQIYFAKGIGPIETVTYVPGEGISTSVLIDYSIK